VSDTVPLEFHQGPTIRGREAVLDSWRSPACGSERRRGGGEGHEDVAEIPPIVRRREAVRRRGKAGKGVNPGSH
jgi:hypothetical protein